MMVVKVEERDGKEENTWRIDHEVLDFNILLYVSEEKLQKDLRGHSWGDSDIDDSVLKSDGES